LHLIVDVDRYLVALDNQRVDGAGIVPRSGGRRDGAVARVSHHVCLDLLHQRRHPARGEQPRRARRAAAAARLGEHVDVAIVVVLLLDDLLLLALVLLLVQVVEVCEEGIKRGHAARRGSSPR